MVQKVLISFALLVGVASAEQINVPVSMRQHNTPDGSCAHAALVTTLRYEGRADEAAQWWATHRGGEWPAKLDKEMSDAGLEYVQTLTGGLNFIEGANAAGYLVEVEVNADKVTHALLITDIDANYVRIIDVNHIKSDWRMRRSDFLDVWTGWAFYVK